MFQTLEDKKKQNEFLFQCPGIRIEQGVADSDAFRDVGGVTDVSATQERQRHHRDGLHVRSLHPAAG